MTPELIRGLHRTLHIACGMPALSPTLNDITRWRDFLAEMLPLAEDPGGPISPHDIQSVIGEMRRQNKNGDARWSLRPGKILSEPEAFRDLILITRARRRAAQQRAQESRTRPLHDPLSPNDLSTRRQEFQKLRQSLGLTR